jgi:hypothetical protein
MVHAICTADLVNIDIVGVVGVDLHCVQVEQLYAVVVIYCSAGTDEMG